MKKETQKKEKDYTVISLRMRNPLLEVVDKERHKYVAQRSNWICQAIVERLERLGYDIEKL